MNSNLLDSIFGYTQYEPEKEKIHELSTRADHAINSVINLLDYIDSDFSEEIAEDLKKRLFLSIKNRDYKRFRTGLENLALREDKK